MADFWQVVNGKTISRVEERQGLLVRTIYGVAIDNLPYFLLSEG